MTIAHIGYARTSTVDQQAGFEAQIRDLKAAGCTKIFNEQVSSVDKDKRDQLAAALDYAREGDILIVTKLDRLARSVAHLVELMRVLDGKGVKLRILGSDIDTTTPNGALLLNILGSVAQFEREIMLERQREGIAKAKALGKYKGRKPTARAKAGDVSRLHAEGMSPTAIAKELKIGRSSVYRALGGAQKDKAVM